MAVLVESQAGYGRSRRGAFRKSRVCFTWRLGEAHKKSTLQKDYASEVQQKIYDAGMYADIDLTGETLSKKIRNAEIAQYNFIIGTYFAPKTLASLIALTHS